MPSGKSGKTELMERLDEITVKVVGATVRLNTEIARLAGISLNDLNALNIMIRMGDVTPGQLSEELGLTTGATTRLIDRLERERLALRIPNQADRRKVTVTIGPAISERIAPYFQGIGDLARETNASFTAEELEVLLRWQTKSLEITLAAIRGLRKEETELS